MILTAWLTALAAAAATPSDLTPNCRGLSSLRSNRGAVERQVRHVFQNGGSRPLRLAWVDSRRRRTDMGEIAPSEFKSIQTVVGDTFVLTAPDDRCRAAVRVGDILTGTYVGTSRYRRVAMPGWNVFIDRALNPAEDPASAALAAVDRMLRDAEAAVPAAALAQLRRTPIFLHDHAGWGGMFHYDPGWLTTHGRTVELTDAIEISDAASFLETARLQPAAVLHELAHGFHAKLPAADRAEIDAAYARAMSAGLYRRVGRNDGTTGPAYAGVNAAEYFAELSEAYFSRNDFFPYTRDELLAYDPEAARLLARVWGVPTTQSPSAP